MKSLLTVIILFNVFCLGLNAQPSPREIYLKNKSGVISLTTIREFTNSITNQLWQQAEFFCFDGNVHYFLYDGFNNGWYRYKGYNSGLASLTTPQYNNEILFVYKSCNDVVLRQGKSEKRFDILSDREAYLEYDRKFQSIVNGTYPNMGGNSNSSSHGSTNSTQKDYNKCRMCNGTGRCTSCNGRGTSIITGHSEVCYQCRGDGRCRTCWGKGRY